MSIWMGAGVVTAGVSAAMLGGAGVAIASTDPGAGGETSTSDASVTGNPRAERDKAEPDADTKTDTEETDADTEETDTEETDADTEETETEADAEETAAEETDAEGTEAEETEAEETDSTGRNDESDVETDVETEVETALPVTTVTESLDMTPDAFVEDDTETATGVLADATEPTTESAGAADTAPTTDAEAAEVLEPTPGVARLTVVSTAAETTAEVSAPKQTLLSIVGTIVFNLYSFAIRVFGGPPLLPWGSTVTVRSSKVEIDCGEGYVVPADWYVPEGPTPTRLIYLQHGFLAAGPFYSYTASRLAEATHSIVVTTSLTSNFLACDGCWVGGTQMHEAVAGLFVDGNTALADSAAAAGYSPSLLAGVDRVVLMGHSAGGGLAAGAAGYMAHNGAIDRLAGVVMLDGVGFGQVLPEALQKLPDDVPIYNLAGKAYYWNMNGSSGVALEQSRSGQFHSVRLVGGLHSDTMLGGNPLVQAGLNLVTGWSKIENVKAAEILSAAWVNDMFAGAPTPGSPYYGAAGDTLTIDTPRGTATAYVMPGPPERLTFIDKVFQFFADIAFGINFATCVAPSDELSTSNTVLSLDGRTKAGQSIGQQCMQG
ncbi:MAG: hypothetical protein WBB00_16825 [Mycobacterium sp.]